MNRIKPQLKLVLLISLLFILASCTKYQDHNYQTRTCDNGYAYFDGKCCLDSNGDNLCDSDNFKEADIRELNVVHQETVQTKPQTTPTASSGNNGEIEGTYDLSNFFDIFDEEVPVVIGEEGNAYEIKILNNFMSELVTKNKIPPGSFRALIDTDDEYESIKNKPHLLFGTGCNNIRVKELIGDCTSLPDIKEDEGMMIAFNDVYLIVANNGNGLKAITNYLVNNGPEGKKIVKG